jgi:DNA-binding NtrC family response regulator
MLLLDGVKTGVKTIFVLDDDADTAEVMAQGLAAPERQVRAFSDPASALGAIEHEPVDLLIADLKMPWMSGGDVVGEARRRRAGLPIFLVSGFDEAAAIAARVGAVFLPKPVDLDTLRAAVERALG